MTLRRIPNTSLVDWAKLDSLPIFLNTGTKYLRDDWTWQLVSWAWDMLVSIYDPTNKAADAFSMDNMVETATKKILTSAERTLLGNTSWTNSGDNAPNSSALALDQTTPQTITWGQPIQNTLTASELVATDWSKKLSSLPVATYPSLAELAYVKWVTSAIQTQLNGKQVAWTYSTDIHSNITALNAVTWTNTWDQSASDFDIKDLTDSTWLKTTRSGKQDALWYTAENSANKKTTLNDNSDTYYPTQKAVKTAVDWKMTNPMTTAWDIIYGWVSWAPTRLWVWADWKVLKLVAGVPSRETEGWALSKATWAEVDTGTDDTKYVTAKAMKDSTYLSSMSDVDAASDTVAGKVELATASETSTGTDATRAVTPDGLAGSNIFGRKWFTVIAVDSWTDVSAADGKAYIAIPECMNGMNLVRANAVVNTAGTTNATTIDIYNVTDSHDMLSTAISIASGWTVGTAWTVDTSYDDVATNDILRIDVTSASTTKPKWLIVVLEFQLP